LRPSRPLRSSSWVRSQPDTSVGEQSVAFSEQDTEDAEVKIALQRMRGIAFDDALFEPRGIAGAPERRAVDDAIPERTAVGALAALERPRNAHELALGGVARHTNGGVAVPCHVHEGEMRGQVRVRRTPRRCKVSGALILQTCANAVMEQEVDRGLRASIDVRKV
jgi:hypothetical protein